MSIFQFENNQPLSGYPQNNPTGLPVPSVSPPVMPPPCWGSTDESYSRRYDTRTPSSAFPNNGFAGAIPPNPPPVSITPPISPPPNWGGDPGMSRRYDGKPFPEPKNTQQRYELDAMTNQWLAVTIINGRVKKRTPLTTGFSIQLVVNIIDPVTRELKYVVVQYFTNAPQTIVLSVEEFRNGRFIQNMQQITRLPGCSRSQANALIEFLIHNALSLDLTLYPRQGFVQLNDGSLVFAANPDGQQIPDNIIPLGLRIRSLLPGHPDLTATNRLRILLETLPPLIRLLLLFRCGSEISYFLAQIGIRSGIFLIITPSSNATEEQLSILTSTNDTRLHRIPLIDNSNKKAITDELNLVWDGTAVFGDHSLADETAKTEDTLRCLMKEARGGTGNGRKSVVLISQFAAYTAAKITSENVLSVSTDGVTLNADAETIRQLTQELDAIVIYTMLGLPESIRMNYLANCRTHPQQWKSAFEGPVSELAPFLIAARQFLTEYCGISLLTDTELGYLLNKIYKQTLSATTADQVILNNFSEVLSQQLRTGAFTIIQKAQRMRIDPDAKNVIIDGNLLFLSGDQLDEIVQEMQTAHRRSSVLNALRQNGALNATDGDTHPIQTYDINGNPVRLFWYALSAEILSADVLHMIRNLDSEQFWLAPDEVPERDFVPLLRDESGRVAGRIIRQQDAENSHTYVTGQSGAGKTYVDCQLMAKMLSLDHHAIVFDNSDSTTYEAMCRNLSKKYVDENVAFIDIDTDGIPVDLFRIDRDATKPTQKKALRGILTAGVGELSAPQKNRLSSVLSDMLDLIDKSEPIRPCDILAMLQEDGATYESLRSRFEPLLEDIDALGMASQSWGEVFQQNTGKIIVIRTASGSAEHGDQLIDMMLSTLFSYQKENHDVPLDIFIDELQNQNLSTDSPIYQIMKEGRKDGIAFVGATQDFYPFNTELGKIMSKADMQIILRPTPNSANAVAANLRFKKGDEAWFDTMLRGDAIIKGWFYSKIEQRNIPRTLSGRLASFIERDADDDVSQND